MTTIGRGGTPSESNSAVHCLELSDLCSREPSDRRRSQFDPLRSYDPPESRRSTPRLSGAQRRC